MANQSAPKSQQPTTGRVTNGHSAQEKFDHNDHTPLLAMWYQTRAAIGEAIIPLLAGLKTAWLVAFAPVRFFRAEFGDETELGGQSTAQLFSPFDLLWRTFTKEARTPLGPAKLLIFAIVAMVLVEQGLQVGQDVGVQAGVQDETVQQEVAALEPEVAQAVTEAIEAGVEAGLQVANAEAVQDALAEPETQEANPQTDALQSDTPSPQAAQDAEQSAEQEIEQKEGEGVLQSDSIDELTDAAVARVVESVNEKSVDDAPAAEAQETAALSLVDLASIEETIRRGIETGIEAGVEINTAWEQSGSLLQRVVGLALRRLPPVVQEQVAVLQSIYTASIQPFVDQAFVSTILTLIRHLLSVMVFAYIFDILIGRSVTEVQSYTFWLYLEAVQLISVALYFAVFQLFPNLIIPIQQVLTTFFERLLTNPVSTLLFNTLTGDALGLEAKAAAFWFLENGFHSLLWLYIFPMFLLPRLVPGVTARGVLLSTFLGRLLYLLLGAVTLFGLVALIAYIGS